MVYDVNTSPYPTFEPRHVVSTTLSCSKLWWRVQKSLEDANDIKISCTQQVATNRAKWNSELTTSISPCPASSFSWNIMKLWFMVNRLCAVFSGRQSNCSHGQNAMGCSETKHRWVSKGNHRFIVASWFGMTDPDGTGVFSRKVDKLWIG